MSSHPEEIIVYKQEALKAAGVVQDDRLGTQTAFHRLICTQSRVSQHHSAASRGRSDKH